MRQGGQGAGAGLAGTAALQGGRAGSDASLVSGARSGDAAAFGTLYERYRDAVYRYRLARTGSSADAEDMTSDVFVKALGSLDRNAAIGRALSPRRFLLSFAALSFAVALVFATAGARGDSPLYAVRVAVEQRTLEALRALLPQAPEEEPVVAASPTPSPEPTPTPKPIPTPTPKPTAAVTAGVVSGTVLDHDGRPAAEVCVSVVAGQCQRRTTATGTYRLAVIAKTGQTVTLCAWRTDATGRMTHRGTASAVVRGTAVEMPHIALKPL
ncbi:MAG: hypothetical protein FJ028_10220 [Chloroflexi bacterium]|nr:hypothetical protein [Chloroflexota bacterium]